MPNWLSVWGMEILGEGSFCILYFFCVLFLNKPILFNLKFFNKYIMEKLDFNFC